MKKTAALHGPLILLDRDGTIMEDRHYLHDPAEVVLLSGAGEALRALREAGCTLVVVSNQSGIGRGLFTEEDMRAVNARLQDLLAAYGVVLDGIYCCPHAPEAQCHCRKPRTGMVEQAVAQHGFSLQDVYMVGDKECDVALGLALGAHCVLLQGGDAPPTGAHYVACDLGQAAAWILEQMDRERSGL